MAVLKGKATVKSVSGITLTAGIVSGSTAAFQNFKGTITGDTKETLDGDGNAVALYLHNNKKTLTITVVPIGATVADARTAMATWTALARGLEVTVADADNTTWDGDYVLMSVSDSRGNPEPATVEIELMNGVENDLSATIT